MFFREEKKLFISALHNDINENNASQQKHKYLIYECK